MTETGPLSRKRLLRQFPWAAEHDQKMVIAANLDGLLSAALLHHHFGWRIVGYYDDEELWLAEEESRLDDLIWVAIPACRQEFRSISTAVMTTDSQVPDSLAGCCNPNLVAGIGAEAFDLRYPFSTLLFLLWLHNVPVRKNLVARLLALAAADSWMVYQQNQARCRSWFDRLPGMDWKWLFQRVDSALFEQRLRDKLIAPLERLVGAMISSASLGRHLGVPNPQVIFNPDWDDDIALHITAFAGTYLKWSPPPLPAVASRGRGELLRIATDRQEILSIPDDLPAGGVLSCAFSSNDTVKFTAFTKDL